MRERELTFEERARWGKCETCGAEDGEACCPHAGFTLGGTWNRPPKNGAHFGRLQRAPKKVREVPCD